MKGFHLGHIGDRDEFITAESTRSSGVTAYDSDGRLVSTGDRETITFYGNIMDKKSNPVINPLNPGRRDTRRIEITADSRDVENITTDFTLTYAGSTDVFQVIDKFDVEFRFTTMLIAEQVR